LEKRNGKAYSFEDTKEIGDGLIDFFMMLMEFDSDEEIPKEYEQD
jgi:hypothetical protein